MILEDEEATARLGARLARVARQRRRDRAVGAARRRQDRARARASSRRSAMRATSPSPSFAIVQPYEAPDPPVWHVDLYRIEDASEIEELGLDSAADAVAAGRMAGAAGRRMWPEALALSLDFAPGRREHLDSQGAPVMGRAMAAPMNPPAHAPEFLAASGWDGRRDPAARRRCLASAAISGSSHGERSGGADGRAAAARGPAAVRRGRRMARVGRPQSAPQILARDLDKGLLLLDDFGDCAAARVARRGSGARAASSTSLRPTCSSIFTGTPPMPGLKPHGLDQWLEELKLFTDWYCPAVGAGRRRRRLSRGLARGARAGRGDGLGPGHRASRLSCREYHAGRGPRTASRHFGLLDFQDALAGHPAYDLASVLEDARRDVAPAIERAMIDRYVARDRPRRGVRARLLGAGGAAQHPHPRRLHAAVEARRQAALPPVPAAHVGPARARSRPAAPRAGPRLVRREHRARASARAVEAGGVSQREARAAPPRRSPGARCRRRR